MTEQTISDELKATIDAQNAKGRETYGGPLDKSGLEPEEFIDHAVQEYVDGAQYLLGLKRAFNERNSSYDLTRLLEWMDDPKRLPAQTAFTSGEARQIAYRCELILQDMGAAAKVIEEVSTKNDKLAKHLMCSWTLIDGMAKAEEAKGIVPNPYRHHATLIELELAKHGYAEDDFT